MQRVVHLDQLSTKLLEDRVRRVIEPLLNGASEQGFSSRDVEYARDLGHVAADDPLRIANPIYGEVIPPQLTHPTHRWCIERDPTGQFPRVVFR